jgi:hypothetical protein
MRFRQLALPVRWTKAREIIFYFGNFPERRPNNMETTLLVRVIFGVLAVVVLAVIISRRKKSA